jgi:hypothetical protein
MTLENDPNKWKYLDLRFCNEAKLLQAGVGENDKILDMTKSLENDVCAATCPSDLSGKCKCIKQSDANSMDFNQVICGREIDGIVYSCPEKCCGSGAGCPEPLRPDVTTLYGSVVTSTLPIEDDDDDDDETDEEKKNMYRWMSIGGGFIFFIIIILFLLSYKA